MKKIIIDFNGDGFNSIAVIHEEAESIEFISGGRIKDHAFVPPLCFGISGEDRIVKLRDALLEMVPLPEGSSAAPLMEELVARRKEYESSLAERDILMGFLKALEKEKETWDRQVLSMENNHQDLVFNLQTMIDFLKIQNDELNEKVARVRKNKNAAIEEFKAENLLLKNQLGEKQRTQESLRGQLAEANRIIGELRHEL